MVHTLTIDSVLGFSPRTIKFDETNKHQKINETRHNYRDNSTIPNASSWKLLTIFFLIPLIIFHIETILLTHLFLPFLSFVGGWACDLTRGGAWNIVILSKALRKEYRSHLKNTTRTTNLASLASPIHCFKIYHAFFQTCHALSRSYVGHALHQHVYIWKFRELGFYSTEVLK